MSNIQYYHITLEDANLEERAKLLALLKKLNQPLFFEGRALESLMHNTLRYDGYDWSGDGNSQRHSKPCITLQEALKQFQPKAIRRRQNGNGINNRSSNVP